MEHAQEIKSKNTSQGWVFSSFSSAVGRTPLIRLKTLSNATGCEIYGKAEFMNPGGSVKDRAALSIIEAAERRGQLSPGGTIVEATAGNTGIGLVHIANERGYKSIFTLPASASQEKVDALRARGAQVIVCPAVPLGDPQHFQNVAKEKAASMENTVWTNQFDNLDNMDAHYRTTGPEIWEQTHGQIDGFICSCGTGGTIAGTSKFLKEKKTEREVKCLLASPIGSGVVAEKLPDGSWKNRLKTAEEKKGSSVLEGIASSRVYGNLDQASLDGELILSDECAVEMCRFLLKKEGLFVGGSAGLNAAAAYLLAKRLGPGHTIVTILCDTGDRYMTKIFSEDFLREKQLQVGKGEDLSFLDAELARNGISN
eukprot:TRINITY_DN5991_c0_g1_i1.p1 TRINITY_DN5991_c0_g1~~TRINITY_DN5991_c0_g1_i1.p1  ORF type:complete len:369 (+),score=55.43 TRINITY_DN5991_c0_g1_i1:15-1121(+)